MSGSPKFSEAEIAEWKQKILDAQRQRQAELERQRREEAEEAERQRQLEESRYRLHLRIQALLSDLQWQWANLYSQDAVALQYRCQNQQDKLVQAESETQLLTLSEELVRIEWALRDALYRKRRDEAEKKRRADIERQQFELDELQQRVAQIPKAQALSFDAAGRQQVQCMLQNVRDAIAVGNPVAVRRPLAQATALVQKHLRQITQGDKDWQQQQAQAHQQVADLKVIVAGLKADPVVMRWQATAVQELETQINATQRAIAEGQVKSVVSDLADMRQRRQTILETANTAQNQAQRRDYIAESIGQALQEMGFNITFHQPEHPDHPASAVILGATTQTGKGISVSVPIAGQVFYDVNGYVKHSMATVEGNTAAVCDEAEQMLTDMHSTLDNKFGVKMGEVFWQGKDPNRQLRQANPLPNNQRSRYRRL